MGIVRHGICICDIVMPATEQYKVREAVPLLVSLPRAITPAVWIVCFDMADPLNLAGAPKACQAPFLF
jgi:hypothetical protein